MLTKMITAPLRLCGAVRAMVPAAGDTAREALAEPAETVDDIPL